MKGKIDERGFLYIYRQRNGNPTEIKIGCPYNYNQFCGDWCHMFGEHYEVHDGECQPMCNHDDKYFVELIDERLLKKTNE